LALLVKELQGQGRFMARVSQRDGAKRGRRLWLGRKEAHARK